MEHGQNNKSEGVQGFTDLRDRSEITRDEENNKENNKKNNKKKTG